MKARATPQRRALQRAEVEREFAQERYKYILQQIHTLNENVYKFLAIYQTLTAVVVGGGLTLFVSYRKWGIAPPLVRSGLIGLMWLETGIAAFTVLLIYIGILSWLDYRHEECDLTDRMVGSEFRERPKVGNFFRWYETYIMLFIVAATCFMWIYTLKLLLPGIK